jgi:hypothetical protein
MPSSWSLNRIGFFLFLEVIFFVVEMVNMDESSSLLLYTETLSFVPRIAGTGRLAAS